MFSIPDMALLGAAALLLFGPEQLPRVARKAGNVMREIQNTSQSFIREMERAADIQDEVKTPAYDPLPYEPVPYDDAPTMAMEAIEPPAPDPEHVDGVAEKLAEPRPAAGWDAAPPVPGALKHIFGEPDGSAAGPAAYAGTEPPPQREHVPDF